ncbi:FYVE, RhoGEF and PH domain-containing protein 6, partial [Exaiptasia diaphana]
ELGNAISALTKKKSTFLLSKDGTVSPPEGGEEESKLGDKAPVWIQDTRVTMCMLCTDKFTVTNRRHH